MPGAKGGAHFDVFLSYNSRDREIVERIAERLKRSGLEPWLDKWSQTPGGEWQEELGRGIEASRACAVFVGPSDLGAWGLQELAFALDRSARERDFRVFPVLLPGVREPFDPTLLPHFLRTRTWVDYRRGHSSERALQDLIAAVKGVPFGPSVAIEPQDGAQALPRPSAMAGTVTLLFTDLVGSTELLERVGDDEAERLRRLHFGVLRDVLAARGGHEVKSLGDGLMVVFGSAVGAVGCAVAMQQAVLRHNRRQAGPRLGVRIGLHVGDPIRDEDDYFGTPVVIARRLCDAAEGGQILTSELVQGVVGSRGGHRFRPLGEVALKGVATPVAACEVVWTHLAPVQFRFLPRSPVATVSRWLDAARNWPP